MPVENLYTQDCIRTVSGQYVNVFNPDHGTILIEDIAHALSMQCRFGAHLKHFYSVAEHSKLVSDITTGCKLQALMHDASEAYLMDIPRPIKLRLSNYKEIEEGLMKVIAAKFRFEYPLSDETKTADESALQMEWKIYMLERNSFVMQPEVACAMFLHLFNKLSK